MNILKSMRERGESTTAFTSEISFGHLMRDGARAVEHLKQQQGEALSEEEARMAASATQRFTAVASAMNLPASTPREMQNVVGCWGACTLG